MSRRIAIHPRIASGLAFVLILLVAPATAWAQQTTPTGTDSASKLQGSRWRAIELAGKPTPAVLDPERESHVGAVGIMQLMPETGAQMQVGDIHVAESNIHAGAKYMDQLMEKYFADAHFSEGNRPLFAFASYNAGPGNIAKCRKEAEKQGLDPDKWFNNVEIVVAKKIGTETTTYVRNIYKYYVAYRLMLDAQAERDKAKQQVAPPKS